MAQIDAAVQALRTGRMAIIVDTDNPEDDGELLLAAGHATAEKIAFMMRHTSGILCVPMPAHELERLRLPPMVVVNEDPRGVHYSVSVNARTGIGSGISASDRARTIALLAASDTEPADLTRPGHVFPLRAVDGGVLQRAGHTEAAVDLVRLTGLPPVAVIGEVMDNDGAPARGRRLRTFAADYDIPIVSMADLIAHRCRTERLVHREASSRLPTDHGEFRAYGYRSVLDGREHIALVMGDLDAVGPALVRVHSECAIGNVFRSDGCECRVKLELSMAMIADQRRGVIVYLREHVGGKAYRLPKVDTASVDVREYGVGAQILADLGVRQMRLLTNNPVTRIGLAAYGLEVIESVRLPVPELEPVCRSALSG